MALPALNLVEVGTLTATIIIDNEIDIMSTVPPNTVTNTGRVPHLYHLIQARGDCIKEFPMESICCGAHGLSVLVTATRGDLKHSMLFDTGPEEDMWEHNSRRLGVDLASIERIQLSHWHRDHSGGMLKAISMISSAKKASQTPYPPVIVDLHPSRPDFRGFMLGTVPVSMQADPSFAEIETAGGEVNKSSGPHTVLDDMFLVSGEIPRVTGYETGVKNGIRFENSTGKWEKDESITDERFLMCNLKGKGLVLFTGCSHAGVINASKHAVSLLSSSPNPPPLYAILGGYHLVGEQEANVSSTVKGFKELDPKILLPGHCSGWRVKYEIEKELPGRLVPCTVGSRFTF